jgi:hypothetical protein
MTYFPDIELANSTQRPRRELLAPECKFGETFAIRR